MDRQIFTWGLVKNKIRWDENWAEGLWVLGLLLAAILLFGVNLGTVPLQHGQEDTVAQVAQEIWQAPDGALKWLYPTLAGEPYFNQPPLLHLLIAAAYSIGGVNEWTTRLPGMLLMAVSVPLLYGIGREIFPSRTPAIFSALIYLTLLPVVNSARLATLDGAVLCFLILMIWCVLRSRRDLRWALGAGIGFGLICLTKGMVGLLLGAIALIFLIWDTPRLLTSGYLWGGLLIGSAPVAVWYSFQGLHYGQVFFTHFFNQSWQRVWQPIDDRSSYSWYYLLEICKYAWPWLLFLPQGLKLAWENRNLGWAKLVLIWSGVYLIAISAIATQLPWYILPIYPALALIVGAKLGEVWNWPNSQSYSRVWVVGLGLLGLIGLGSSLYFGGLGPKLDWHLQLVLAFLALTYLMAAILVAQKDVQFISILLWGMYVSLLLFSISPDWIEEPTPNPIKPAAAIKDNTQPKLFLISG